MDDKSNPAGLLSVPKGGGAINGIGETFQPELFTGTGNLSVPIATSPGRGGFGPKLSLQYSTGYGNSPFGWGWQLSIPRIGRKTEKGLPKYDDSDVFIMSGSEDLVPTPEKVPARDGFVITRYRPRTEGLFARIERWTMAGDTHWRVTTRENVTSIYGSTAEARIADPGNESHVYEWLLRETFDARGNHILYEYAKASPELYGHGDPALRLGAIYEQNRQPAQSYVRRIYYGNVKGDLLGAIKRGEHSYLFEVLFDYGDLTMAYAPSPVGQEKFGAPPGQEEGPVSGRPPLRPDPFSTYRAGFEIRTLRRCARVLMFHHIAELGGSTLTRSTDLGYLNNPDTLASFLTSVTVTGYRKVGGGYRTARMPPVTFGYSEFRPREQRYRPVGASGDDMPPRALTDPDFALVDLSGVGLPDVLQGGAAGFRYWRNLGDGKLDRPRLMSQVPAGISLSQPGVGFGDMSGDGRADLLVHYGPRPGFFGTSSDGVWEKFKPYDSLPSFDSADPNVRMTDLNGDGLPDVLMTGDHHFLWYECLRGRGFNRPRHVERQHDLNEFPDVFFADRRVRLADMNGDGLDDVVLVHNGRVDYWPNLGYGQFGKRITMENAPRLDFDFDARHLFFADLDGTGCADLVYVDSGKIDFWFNRSGNGWSDRHTIRGTPYVSDVDSVKFADFFGTGTQTLVWSYDYNFQPGGNYKALDFCGGLKPYVLTEISNNMGATTRVAYAPSTKYALEDEAGGEPWATKLPFPVHVVDKVEVIDHISRRKFVTAYKYHHGYFDGAEREFRGFGRVDRYDTVASEVFSRPGLHPPEVAFDNADSAHHVPPMLTKTWFHTGAYFEDRALMERFRREFYGGDPAALDPGDNDVAVGESPRMAYRALRGSILRSETYALDGSARQAHPYTVTENRYQVKQLQPAVNETPGVYLNVQRESLSYHYERSPDDPRVGHQITLAADDFGNITDSAVVGYPRRAPAFAEQKSLKVLYTHTDFINKVDDAGLYYVGLACQKRSYEVTGINWAAGGPRLAGSLFDPVRDTSMAPGDFRPYNWQGASGKVEKRIVEWTRNYFRRDASAGVLDIDPRRAPIRTLSPRLPLGGIESLGLPYESYQAVFTGELLEHIYGHYPDAAARVTDAILAPEGGYHSEGGCWWAPSGQQSFNKDKFYLPEKSSDAFGNTAVTAYDDYSLMVVSSSDPLGNRIQARNDYRVLQPEQITDINGNITRVAFDALGLVAATAVAGKEREADGKPKGDSLRGVDVDLSAAQLAAFISNPRGEAASLLGQATTRVVYNVNSFHSSRDSLRPVYAATIVRETHGSDLAAGQSTKVQVSFLYSDGFGREIQKKIQAEAGRAGGSGPAVDPRWVGSGWTTYNNKGQPVQRYEPFFTGTHRFEFNARHGVSSTLFYDPPGRVVCTLHANHTYEKVVFDPWEQTTWDVNDTVLLDPRTDGDVKGYTAGYAAASGVAATWRTWYALRVNGTDAAEKDAAAKAASHAGTPTITHLDTLGRVFLTVANNKGEKLETRVGLDIEGNDLLLTDPRGVESFSHRFDIAGRKVSVDSKDAGLHLVLPDAAGQPLCSWDGNGNRVRIVYDALRRATQTRVSMADGTERLAQKIVYGEGAPRGGAARPDEYAANADQNLRGRVYQVYDSAGVVTNTEYDFKGNLMSSERQMSDYREQPDWSVTPPPAGKIYRTTNRYNALNRVAERAITLDAKDPASKPYLYRPAYNEANLLNRVDARLPGDAAFSPFVLNIDYNEKGQRAAVEYANGVTTTYTYDRDTFRLLALTSKRAGGEVLQSLAYTYDPIGNLTRVADGAFGSVFNANQRVDPVRSFTYDALYRLTEARGREHEAAGPCHQFRCDKKQTEFIRLTRQPVNNGQALRNYTETYRYDRSGNLIEVKHAAGPTGSWTRTQTFQADANQKPLSNRLATSQAGCEAPAKNFKFAHDANGNVIRMPYAGSLSWDYADRLRQVETLICTDGPPDRAVYAYDSTGQRVRKVIERGNKLSEERIYLGDFEVYREYNAAGKVKFERSTFHVTDDKRRIALVERRTEGDRAQTRVRYQLDNHLNSSLLEVNEQASPISYEEYYPYGGTAYLAGESETEVQRKRYRYNGKERDDETGLYYYGARYYAPWLGRWISCDPLFLSPRSPQSTATAVLEEGLYVGFRNNPQRYVDRTGLASEKVSDVDIVERAQQRAAVITDQLKHQYPHLRSQDNKAREKLGKKLEEELTKYFQQQYPELAKKGNLVFQEKAEGTVLDVLFKDRGLSIEIKLSERAHKRWQWRKQLQHAIMRGGSHAVIYGEPGEKGFKYVSFRMAKTVSRASSAVAPLMLLWVAPKIARSAADSYERNEMDKFGREIVYEYTVFGAVWEATDYTAKAATDYVKDSPTGQTLAIPYMGGRETKRALEEAMQE